MSNESAQTALTKTTTPDMAILEQVLATGDLRNLTPTQRVHYYEQVCTSVGLNPLTRPFDYLNLNGKITLYAKKECSDQLRALNNVSVTIASREVVDGCFIVTARARTPSGREDEDVGAVVIGNLQGEAKANAMMKAHTKAKRRVTLSVCGLGFLDESEIESMPDAQRVQVSQNGEFANGHAAPSAPAPTAPIAPTATVMPKPAAPATTPEWEKKGDEAIAIINACTTKAELDAAFKKLSKLLPRASAPPEIRQKAGQVLADAEARLSGAAAPTAGTAPVAT